MQSTAVSFSQGAVLIFEPRVWGGEFLRETSSKSDLKRQDYRICGFVVVSVSAADSALTVAIAII